jgi:DNA-binding NarL/FixJ family response regulator
MKSKINVLIVDDHVLFRRGLESLLKQSKLIGFVYHASSLLDVTDYVLNRRIDIIFMDVKMPENDGITITREVMKLNKKIKIIALTMLDDKATIVRMFNAGATGFLTKCTDSKEIFTAIHEVLGGNKFVSSELPSDFVNESEMVRKQDLCSTSFTKRELQVLKLTTQGYSNIEVAKFLNVSIKYIEAVKSKLFDKTGATNSAGLVKFVFESELIHKL